jgi:hypothetical protein
MSSKKSFYEKYYEDQPKITKGIINVIVVGGVAFTGWQIWKAAKRRKEIELALAAAQMANEELKALAQRGIHPSYYTSQYELWSNQLQEAMAGCGTDEDLIFEVMGNMRNDADVLKLISVFGVRYYRPCAGSQPISYLMYLADSQSFGGGIGEWFGYDLSGSDIADINEVLKDNGVAYRF